MTLLPAPAFARDTVLRLGASRIREVANEGMGREDVLAYWFGEPDGVTPAFIREAAKAALDGGDTFYRQNLGLPALREALGRYLDQDPRRIAITSSGVSALMLAAQALLEPGDTVVAVVPLWPNLTEIPAILGARVERVALDFEAQRGWQLDMDKLLSRINEHTRAVFINSPNNPSGWTMSGADQRRLLEHCRARGVWILSDEAYDRLVFDGSYHAPSLLDHARDDDRVIVANTFSKTWQMTGWRLGWLVAPVATIEAIGVLIEYNTSCAPGFVQQAGVVAVEQGEAVARAFVDDLKLRRDHLLAALSDQPRLQLACPPGAMYLFFRVEGMRDSLATCKAWVRDYGLGLAPGEAFGPEGQGFVRWCFAKSPQLLDAGAQRLKQALRAGAVS